MHGGRPGRPGLAGPGGRWGFVCSDGWTNREAAVVCRELGLGYALHALKETWYWQGDPAADETVVTGIRCSGTETSLSECLRSPAAGDGATVAAAAAANCSRPGPRFAAGVICAETAPDLVLNWTLASSTAYAETRPLHMLQCAAEEGCLAAEVGGATWPYGFRSLLRFTSQILNLGRADFRPRASRHDWLWHACHQHYHSMNVFTHYDLLAMNGSRVAEGHKASFCLEDSECQDGVHKRYECANFGVQGITVGCSDVYRHDIDCQWIDITDVPPGDYIFQVVINPDMEVSESDFSNNAMRCHCKYDAHHVWVYNCHTGDSFSDELEKQFELHPGEITNLVD